MQNVCSAKFTFFCEPMHIAQMTAFKDKIKDALQESVILADIGRTLTGKSYNRLFGNCKFIAETETSVSIEMISVGIQAIKLWKDVLAEFKSTDIQVVLIADIPQEDIHVNTDVCGKFYPAKYICTIDGPSRYDSAKLTRFSAVFASKGALLRYLNEIIVDYNKLYNKHIGTEISVYKAFNAIKQFIHSRDSDSKIILQKYAASF